MHAEDELAPISALQHLVFCERQCALIHLERVWVENRLTTEGRHLHGRTDAGGTENRGERRITRAVELRSLRLGLTGRADVVEFTYDESGALTCVTPVEYKRGRSKLDDCDRVQLCAQGLCLEEMIGVTVPRGALYYAAVRRREDVVFDEALRARTYSAAERLHSLLAGGVVPRVDAAPKCRRCSLVDVCIPEVTGSPRTAVARYDQMVRDSLANGTNT